jgi:hypothetical protein
MGFMIWKKTFTKNETLREELKGKKLPTNRCTINAMNVYVYGGEYYSCTGWFQKTS